MTRPDEMTEAEKKADDALTATWAEAVKARLVNRGKAGYATTGINEPPWVTRAQARIDHIYEINGNEITFAVVDSIIAEERTIEGTTPIFAPDQLAAHGIAIDTEGAGEAARKAAIDAAFDSSDAPALTPEEEARNQAAFAKAMKKNKAKRIVDDNYPTPTWAINRFLDTEDAANLTGGKWLEPTAGAGAIIKAVNSYFTGIDWHAVELREEHEDALAASGATSYEIGDFLTVGPALAVDHAKALLDDKQAVYTKPFTVAVTNPPFAKAFEVIERCWPLAEHLVFLLRLNFLEGEGRALWLRDHTPDVYVLPNRPSFAYDGKTDMTAYAWFHWTVDRPAGTPGRLKILESTPRADRK